MKKIIALLLALVFAFGLIACGSSNTPSAPSNPSTPGSETPGTPDEPAQPSASDEVYTLVFSTQSPGASTATAAIQKYLDAITERSNGRIQWELYTDASLVESSGIIDALATGLCDAGMVNYAHQGGKLDLAGVTALPGVYSNSWEATYTLFDMFDNKDSAFRKQLQDNGLVLIGAFMSDGNVIFSKDPIDDISDLAGKRVISTTTAIDDILDRAGAIVVGFSTTESYEALSKNTADACANMSFTSAATFAIEEVCGYCYQLNFCSGPNLYCMSQASWDALPADLQQIIRDVMFEEQPSILYETYVLEVDKEVGSYDKFINAGGVVTVPTAEQIDAFQKEYGQQIWADWVKRMNDAGYDGQAVLDEFLATYKNHAGTNPY